jgi:nitroreductase
MAPSKEAAMHVNELDRASIDHVLTTTRAVRRRLDLDRHVPFEVVYECLEIALQAPTGFNLQNWRWLVVTDPDVRATIAESFRRIELPFLEVMESDIPTDDTDAERVAASSRHLAEHLEQVPIHVIPCSVGGIRDNHDLFASLGYDTDLTNMAASATYGEIWPAAWSFMLALRSRMLGSSLTMIHLGAEPEIARLLDIPDGVSQAGLIPVAYFQGEDFRPGPRRPLDEVAFHNRWGEPLARPAASTTA